MQDKARKLEERLNVLREEAANSPFGSRMSAEYKLVLKEQQAVLEAMEKIENQTNRAFLNIPKFKVDLGLDESVELVDIFNKGLNTTQALEFIEEELPASDERDEIVTFIRESGRGIIKRFVKGASEED